MKKNSCYCVLELQGHQLAAAIAALAKEGATGHSRESG